MNKLFGLVAIGGLIVLAMPSPQANAASLINPAMSSPIAAAAAGSGLTQVHWHWRRWHWHHHHWRHWDRRW